MKNFSFTLFLILLLSANLYSQWQQTSSPGIEKMIFSINKVGNTLFTATNPGVDGKNTYFTTNNGANWNVSTLPIRGDCIVQYGSNIYAGGNTGGFYVSSDNGSSWKNINNPFFAAIYSLCVSDSKLYVGHSNGITVSSDDGVSWNQLNTNFLYSTAVCIAINNSKIYAGTNNGVYSSNDNGANWSSIGLQNKYVMSIAINSTTIFAVADGGVFYSADEGNNWFQITTGLPTASRRVIVKDSNIFVASDDGIFLSVNNGISWVKVFPNAVYSISISGSDIYAGVYDGGVYLSKDNGTSWIHLNPPKEMLRINRTAISGSDIFAATKGGLFYSSDKGVNWVVRNLGYIGYQGITAVIIRDSLIFVGTDSKGVFCSKNNGINWTPFDIVIENLQVYSLAVSGSNIYAGTYDGIYRSTNTGASWNHINPTPYFYPIINSLSVEGPNLVACYSFGVVISTDNGTTWTETRSGLFDPIFVYSVIQFNNRIFAGTSTGVYLLSNNSQWTPINGAGEYFKNIRSFASSGSTLFVGNLSGDVFFTSNSGNNWSRVNFQKPIGEISSITVADSYIYAAASTGLWYCPISQMITDVNEGQNNLPTSFSLSQNYPNPFNPSTTIKYFIPLVESRHGASLLATLKVYDILGREIAILVNEEKSPGNYEVKFDGTNISSGVYFYRLQSGSHSETKKLVLMK